MAIEASPQINNLLFVLIGERLIQADEDLAYESRLAYGRLGGKLRDLSDLIEQSVLGASRSLPQAVGQNYQQAMQLFVNDGGTNHLKEFARQLDEISDSRVQTSSNIIESKWQIIAEVIRLLIELFVTAVLAIFSGGSGAGQMALARARSRVFILTVLDWLISRTHMMPFLSEAIEEAFQAFAVRLAMMAFGPNDRRPTGIDWMAIGIEGLAGAFMGAFSPVLKSVTKNLGGGVLKSLGGGFLSGQGPLKDVAKDVLSKSTLPSWVSKSTSTVTHQADDFLVMGFSETAAEVAIGGLVTGKWTWNDMTWGTTFVGSGLSSVSESGLDFSANKFGGLIGSLGSGSGVNSVGFSAPAVSGGGFDGGGSTGTGGIGGIGGGFDSQGIQTVGNGPVDTDFEVTPPGPGAADLPSVDPVTITGPVLSAQPDVPPLTVPAQSGGVTGGRAGSAEDGPAVQAGGLGTGVPDDPRMTSTSAPPNAGTPLSRTPVAGSDTGDALPDPRPSLESDAGSTAGTPVPAGTPSPTGPSVNPARGNTPMPGSGYDDTDSGTGSQQAPVDIADDQAVTAGQGTNVLPPSSTAPPTTPSIRTDPGTTGTDQQQVSPPGTGSGTTIPTNASTGTTSARNDVGNTPASVTDNGNKPVETDTGTTGTTGTTVENDITVDTDMARPAGPAPVSGDPGIATPPSVTAPDATTLDTADTTTRETTSDTALAPPPGLGLASVPPAVSAPLTPPSTTPGTTTPQHAPAQNTGADKTGAGSPTPADSPAPVTTLAESTPPAPATGSLEPSSASDSNRPDSGDDVLLSTPVTTSLVTDSGWTAAYAGATRVERWHTWADPVSTPAATDGSGTLRYVVRSGFDVRRFVHQDTPVTDLTVEVEFTNADMVSDSDRQQVWARMVAGVQQVFNAPGHRLPNGDVLHVTVVPPPPGGKAHLKVPLTTDGPTSHHAWRLDSTKEDLAHEIGHQLGLRDESRNPSAPHRPEVAGSLMGAYNQLVSDPDDSPDPDELRYDGPELASGGYAQGGLRHRHLALLHTLIGDIAPSAHSSSSTSAPVRRPNADWSAFQRASKAADPLAPAAAATGSGSEVADQTGKLPDITEPSHSRGPRRTIHGDYHEFGVHHSVGVEVCR